MKRFDPKNKYLGWGITAFGVIACCILFYMLLQHGKSIGDAISSLLGILSPIIWGLVIAYLLWPLTKVFQRKLFEPLLKKLRPKKPVRTSLARGLSVALSILVALIIIAALIWLIIPQIYTSVESIVLNYQEYYDTITGWINKFFENNLNVSATARKLFVHRNTLVYRLEKIKKLTGLDLREFDDAITFKVALMVKKYLTSRGIDA